MRKHTVSALKFCFPISDHVRDTLKSNFPIVLSTMSPMNAIKNLKEKTIPRLSVHNNKCKKKKNKKRNKPYTTYKNRSKGAPHIAPIPSVTAATASCSNEAL